MRYVWGAVGSVVIAAFGLAEAAGPSTSKRPLRADPHQSFDHSAALRQARGAAAGERLRETTSRLPLQFEANRGQAGAEVKYLARGAGYRVLLTATEAVLHLSRPRGERQRYRDALVRLKLAGANRSAAITAEGELPGKVNYIRGREASGWRTGIPTYARVRYREVYPGVDVAFYGNQGRLEHDFVVRAGADPGAIALRFEGDLEGDAPVKIAGAGELEVRTAGGEVRLRRPYAYQWVDGARKPVAVSYRLAGQCEARFALGAYDRRRELVIDPVLVFSTYFGGSYAGGSFWGGEYVSDLAVDAAGDFYITGITESLDYPTTPGSYQPSDPDEEGDWDAYVTKFSKDGARVLYSTYLGSRWGIDATGIAVDAQGNAYVSGQACYSFPIVNGFNLSQRPCYHAFLAKLSADGSRLLYSSLINGNTIPQPYPLGYGTAAMAVACDNQGIAWVAGWTQASDLPVTANAFQKTFGGGFWCAPGDETCHSDMGGDAFLAKIDTTKRGVESLVLLTYLGGRKGDLAAGLALDAAGSVYVTGQTGSPDFPVTAGAAQANVAGFMDGFLLKAGASGNILYSTLLGGSHVDHGADVAVDAAGNAYLTGYTMSNDFPTTPGAYQRASAGGFQSFVAKVQPGGSSLAYSTYLGDVPGTPGYPGDSIAYRIAVDPAGAAYVIGDTWKEGFPVVDPIQPQPGGGDQDAFIAKLAPDGSRLTFATYLGGSSEETRNSGIGLDAAGGIYVAGRTCSTDFPTVRPLQGARKGTCDLYVAKIAFYLTAPIDIKPGSFPNTIKLGAEGSVPVAILSTPGFDARRVDPATVTLASAPVALKGKGTPMASLEDVNGDGRLDLVVHVETQALQVSESDTECVLEGRTFDGQPIRGSDTIRVVP